MVLAGLGACVNVRDCQGNTPLHLANMNNNDITIKLLGRLGTFKVIKNDDGKIPEDYGQVFRIVKKVRKKFQDVDVYSARDI